jgi:hypothetical protein
MTLRSNYCSTCSTCSTRGTDGTDGTSGTDGTATAIAAATFAYFFAPRGENVRFIENFCLPLHNTSGIANTCGYGSIKKPNIFVWRGLTP